MTTTNKGVSMGWIRGQICRWRGHRPGLTTRHRLRWDEGAVNNEGITVNGRPAAEAGIVAREMLNIREETSRVVLCTRCGARVGD